VPVLLSLTEGGHLSLPVPIASALLGAIVLLFGRKIFWLCVAAVGFAVGVELAPHLVTQPSPILHLSFALVLGFAGALLALLLQKVAIAVLGFVAGGKLAVTLMQAFLVQHGSYDWIAFLLGGIIGALLLLSLFNWALIVCSALLGAYMVCSAITLPATGATIAYIGLTALGVLAQGAMLRRNHRSAL
jgi:hypothetical protein